MVTRLGLECSPTQKWKERNKIVRIGYSSQQKTHKLVCGWLNTQSTLPPHTHNSTLDTALSVTRTLPSSQPRIRVVMETADYEGVHAVIFTHLIDSLPSPCQLNLPLETKL